MVAPNCGAGCGSTLTTLSHMMGKVPSAAALSMKLSDSEPSHVSCPAASKKKKNEKKKKAKKAKKNKNKKTKNKVAKKQRSMHEGRGKTKKNNLGEI